MAESEVIRSGLERLRIPVLFKDLLFDATDGPTWAMAQESSASPAGIFLMMLYRELSSGTLLV